MQHNKFTKRVFFFFSVTWIFMGAGVLISLLEKIVTFMVSHTHPLAPTPPIPVAAGVNVADITKDLNTPNLILNNNIRIN